MIYTETVRMDTKGDCAIINITRMIEDILKKSKIKAGFVLINSLHTTAVPILMEYESGLIRDTRELFEKLVSRNDRYHHDDGNAHSHLRATLLSHSVTIPIQDRKLILGSWQSIVFIDFDIKPRTRTLVIQVSGE